MENNKPGEEENEHEFEEGFEEGSEGDGGDDFQGEIIEDHLGSKRRRRSRKKIKIRKRVKIKRKASPKKRVKKTFEMIMWIIVVAAFVTTLVILILQLDFNTKNKKIRSVGMNAAVNNILHLANTLENDKHFLL